jgi:hypothetical protein
MLFAALPATGVFAQADDVGAALQSGADRLTALQQNDGGWDWPLDDGDPMDASPVNTLGPIAKGLAEAYAFTQDPAHLAALQDAGVLLLTKIKNFSPSDGYLAVALDEIFGGTTYKDHLQTNFYGPLAAGTYDREGLGTLYDTAAYVNRIRTIQTGDLANLAAWDIGMGLVGAASCGADTAPWIAGVKAEIDELDGSASYDVLGLAGAVYGLAFVDVDYDPTAGEHTAADSVADLAAILASYQINYGGFAWNSEWVKVDDYDESIQETAYAILALNEIDRAAYIANILGAADYMLSVQLETGGWQNDEFYGGENNEVTGEALWAMHVVYNLPLNELWVCETGDCGHPDAEFSTIQAAIDAAAEGATIHVAAGTYTEGITQIDKNLTIIGDENDKPTITPTENTGTANDIGATGRGWYQIHSAANVTFENIVFDGSGKNIYTAVHFHADSAGGSVKNCDFVNIKHSQYQGRGINNYGQHLDVIGCNFNSIERIGVFTYGSTAETFVSNSFYTGKGNGDWLDYGVEVGGGGHAEISNSTITGIGESTSGWGSAAILVTDAYPTNGPAAVTISNNDLTNNYSAIHVGYGESDGVIVEAKKNNFNGSYHAITTTTDLVNLVDGSPNWFGNIAGPADNQIVGNVVYNPWCGDSECTFTVPDGNGVIELSGHINIPGGIVVDQPGLTFLLKDGTVIENDSPCFEINADYTTITTESPLGAVCIPTEGSNGINVNGDRTNIIIEGLEIDGAAGTNGIDFDGVVTDLIVRDNYIHGLAGDGLYFAAAPAGVVQIQGNLFMGNTGNGIKAGALSIPAEYNAWGDAAGAAAGDGISAGVDADPWTHVDLYLDSSGSPWEDQVVLGEQITYAVKANLVNAMGADFVLKYPTNLSVASITLGENFNAEAVDSLTTGKLNFIGYQTTSGASVTGSDVTLFTVVFNTLSVGKNLPMDFDEETDLFSMAPDTGGDPSTNIYATSLEDREIDVILLPELTSDDIQGYYLTGEPRDFSVRTVNPADGAAYSNAIFRYTIYGADLTDIASFTNTIFGAMPLEEDGLGNLVGEWGLAPTGFAMTAPYDVTTTFNIEFNTAGDYVFELTLVDLATDTVLATLTDTAEVYDAPTMTPDTPATFMSDEQVEFSVNLSNPATGIETNVYAEIVLTGLIPADIQSLQYFEVTDDQWHDLPYDYDSVSGEMTIHYGPAVGFPMPASYNVDALFRVIFNNNVNLGFAYTGTLYDYDFDPDRGLATMSGSSTVYANFDVTGTVSMQGRTVRSGVQMALAGSYDSYADTSSSLISLNLSFEDVIAGTYQITTTQDRYLNITTELGKLVTISAATELPALELKGGNADNDMDIDINDAGIIGGQYGHEVPGNGDVNFDNRVNIQDLALVGGNFDLTSEEAYAGWLGSSAEISGQILPDGLGNIHGVLSGDMTLVIDAQGTGQSGNISTFAGTVSGDFTGSVTGTVNAQGIDIMYATVTGSGFPGTLRIFGTFPQTGVPGDFEGTVMIGPERTPVTSVVISGPDTVAVDGTIDLDVELNGDPDDDRPVRWSVYVNHRDYASVDELTGEVTGLQSGTATIIVTILDDSNVSFATKSITIP